MKTKFICACAALLCTLSIPAPAADEAGRVPLFDGKTLDGWDVIKCEAVVQDGSILPKDGFISLQSEVAGGGQCLFRNIYITELK